MSAEKWVITIGRNDSSSLFYELTHVVGFSQSVVAEGTGCLGDVAYECEQIITGYDGWENF